MENVIIIGSGPAGLTAAIYTARAKLAPLVFTGNYLGGQVATTTEVENYPGFPDGIAGPELAAAVKKQAERFGARLEMDEVVEVDLSSKPIRLKTRAGEYETQTVIVTTGAISRKLGVPGEAALTGRGVSYCATCDAFFFQGKHILVVGGGDSALQESLFLTKFAAQVEIVHRRDQLRAGPALVERARKNEKIGYIWDTVVTEIKGEGRVQAVRLKNVKTGEESEKTVDGVFVYIGHIPNTQLFKGQLDMDEEGYLAVDERLHTNIPGVFAAGEVHDAWFRQAIVSAGFGCMAAIEAERYLAELE
ncbi:MAG: thioredoxin-disulfide reductase [Thermoflexales bacterium]|nr:thioredoxin-disulfide reductase [Thermoflexales bacterium]